ncbi:hypothetical protein J437_LFUL015636 [Ladona fulva]|uniref:Uncharacterized protein n=1 Tax=Ladona fulva TaxID=123851 RepID=A0A8K0KP85_LADFU|nr:hypothetical protein J437_LFUL015636 [Ladona fulva]
MDLCQNYTAVNSEKPPSRRKVLQSALPRTFGFPCHLVDQPLSPPQITLFTHLLTSFTHSPSGNGKQTSSTASNPPPPPPLPPTGTPQAFSSQAETGPTESNTRREVEAPHQRAPKPVQRQLVLILPPHFPVGDNALVKPSEILKSIGAKGASGRPQSPADTMPSTTRVEVSQEEVIEEVVETSSVMSIPACGPKPPPLPGTSSSVATDQGMGTIHGNVKQQQQPLATISIHDINSVQLRRTEKLTKTLSAPPMTSTTTSQKSLNIVTTSAGGAQQAYISHKENLIAELKMSRDISGIKKMKVEKAKEEEMHEKEMFVEISKQLTADNFVQKRSGSYRKPLVAFIVPRVSFRNIGANSMLTNESIYVFDAISG